ncbi:Uncharacterised protein [Klebsiella pneumoniae]|uniref:hypothetical protein n=1 Tax=Pseudomonas aeruginosa TaxID=287 RepID=UPI0009CCAE35|nr:hypothetical protein AI2626V1_0727 [Klebsiella pneumoniae]CAH4911288.1 hypothetical protein AI2626V1_0727 [Klebsiella pneumoniae]CAI6142075.1 hypothetical protein DJICPGNB_03795 [Klebsiella pneumoniae]SLX32374.1 Uncharacterised protein [Klebsiella pneumoniae]SLX55426.1 Uncharacterised protein [Klebsiella pneumoniae]
MNNIKIITLFHTNKKIPFMTCIVKNVEENKQGTKSLCKMVIISMSKIMTISSYQNQQMSVIRNE